MNDDNKKKTLKEFLVELSNAEDLLRSFWSNPERTMDSAGLTPEERDLVLRGDLRGIREYLEEQGEGGDVVFVPPVHIHPVHWPWPCPPPK
jgi:hypothetical protein